MEFRELGWREAQHSIETTAALTINPYYAAGETERVVRQTSTSAPGHQVDNVKNRVALDVEWNAKDGNLDRDLANFRALYDVGIIDAGEIVTRNQSAPSTPPTTSPRRRAPSKAEPGEV